MFYDILTKEKKWSHSQACCFIAEVGRENSFNEKSMFGTHTDAANSERNIGIISFQKTRYLDLLNYLRPKGVVVNDQQLQRSRACVSHQIDFIINEINTVPDYRDTKTKFLQDPNVTYDVAKYVLGTNYIRWAYKKNLYSSGHYNRDAFYSKIRELTKSTPKTSSSTESNSESWVPASLSLPDNTNNANPFLSPNTTNNVNPFFPPSPSNSGSESGTPIPFLPPSS